MSADGAVWKQSPALLQESAGNEVFTSDCIVQFYIYFMCSLVLFCFVVCVFVFFIF